MDLQPTTFRLLRALVLHCDRVVSREELLGRSITNFIPSDAPDNSAYSRAVWKSGLSVRGARSLEVTREGQARWIRNNVLGLAPRGSVERIWSTQRDVMIWVNPSRSGEAPRLRESKRQELGRRLATIRRSIDRIGFLLGDAERSSTRSRQQ